MCQIKPVVTLERLRIVTHQLCLEDHREIVKVILKVNQKLKIKLRLPWTFF